MNYYYWDLKFDFNAGTIAVGLVDNGSNVTPSCTQTDHGYSHAFDLEDSVCFNIFDGDGGCTLNSASIIFTNANSGPDASSSPFGGDSTIILGSAALAANQWGCSAVFPGYFRHWVFPQYTVTAAGTYYFSISLTVTSGGNTKTISTDPEMIVGSDG